MFITTTAIDLEQGNRIQKESLENRQNNEAAQRERYYATIHKVSLQNNEKIPGEYLKWNTFITNIV